MKSIYSAHVSSRTRSGPNTLARGWQKFPERCYLQITGVYTFPDYLEGKIFTDFAPPRARC